MNEHACTGWSNLRALVGRVLGVAVFLEAKPEGDDLVFWAYPAKRAVLHLGDSPAQRSPCLAAQRRKHPALPSPLHNAKTSALCRGADHKMPRKSALYVSSAMSRMRCQVSTDPKHHTLVAIYCASTSYRADRPRDVVGCVEMNHLTKRSQP
jgi:hypothetical protein